MDRTALPAGLCSSCRYAQTIASDRGPSYLLCRLAKSDPHFPKYPRLPVRECAGWQPATEAPVPQLDP